MIFLFKITTKCLFYRELLASGTSNSNSGEEEVEEVEEVEVEESQKVKGVESTELRHRHQCQTKRNSVIEKINVG